MNGRDFINSKWVKAASEPATQQQIKNNFGKWSNRVNNTGLLTRAKQLWGFFISDKVTGTQKLVVSGALLFIISPIDLIPDFIPVIGWLDDIGIASFALSYVFSSMDKLKEQELMETEIAGTTEVPQMKIDITQPLDDFKIDSVPSNSNRLSKRLDEFSSIINDLNIPELQNITEPLREKLNENRILNMMFVGRYSTGKSTLINALLGSEILPSAPTPTTKAITFLMNGEKEYLYSEQPDGEIVIHQGIKELTNIYNNHVGLARKIWFFCVL